MKKSLRSVLILSIVMVMMLAITTVFVSATGSSSGSSSGPSTSAQFVISYDLNTEGASVTPDGVNIEDDTVTQADCGSTNLPDGTYNGEKIKMGNWIITGWSTNQNFLADGVVVYPAGTPIPEEILQGAINSKVVLYAVWSAEAPVAPEATEQPQLQKDKSPATSDDVMVVPFIVMMLLSAGAVAVARRRNA